MEKISDAMFAFTAAMLAVLEWVTDWFEDRGVPAWFVAAAGGIGLGMATRYGPLWLGVLIALALCIPMAVMLSMIATFLMTPKH